MFVRSSRAIGDASEESTGTIFEKVFKDLDVALSRAAELSLQLPTTSARLIHTPRVLPPKQAFNEDAHKIVLTEAANLHHLQQSLSQLRDGFNMYKDMQDGRCKPYEDHAALHVSIIMNDVVASGGERPRGDEIPTENVRNVFFCVHLVLLCYPSL
jgi:hypothetical protein